MQWKRGGSQTGWQRAQEQQDKKSIRLLWGFKVFVKMFYRMLQPSVVADGLVWHM